jgi:hypothetical protein
MLVPVSRVICEMMRFMLHLLCNSTLGLHCCNHLLVSTQTLSSLKCSSTQKFSKHSSKTAEPGESTAP